MIPFDAALVPGSGLWFATGWSDTVLASLATGLLGMGLTDITAGITHRLSGDDGEEEPEGGDDFAVDGALDGDDEFGDDEFGDLDGWEDGEDEFDDFGGSEDALGEIEPRLDELENEIASISSTMGTVRSENEAINETVGDIEDDIRKLLEIYEMVTRGVNPFVDEPEGASGVGGSFGLFDGDGSSGDESQDLDPEVAEADAESFFDDDWDDAEFEDDEGFDAVEEEDGFDEVAEFDSPVDATDDARGPTDESDSSDEGKTFDELKSEYEAGGADWTGGNGEEVETRSADPATTDAPTSDRGVDEAPVQDGEPPARADGKPYLGSLPAGYGTELLVIEWLSYLRGCSSTPEALRAIRYYETIGWIGESAADTLAKFLTGMADGEAGPVPNGGTQLTVDHHTRSLRYIGRLGGAEVQIERLDWAGSPGRGARIEGGKQRGIQR